MAVKKQFDWDNLPWQDFQKLCLHLAQNIFPNTNFEEYLRAGNLQAGIDLITVHQPDEKPITIQCKKVQKITVAGAKKIIKEFETNRFSGQASEFILATSAILGSRVVTYLQGEKIRLKNTYRVELQLWDRGFLEEQLRCHYTLVAYYFNEETAVHQCHERSSLSEIPKWKPVTDYIPRTIYLNRTDFAPKQRRYLQFGVQTTTLTEVINENRLWTKHICLVADASQGKSLLLKQTAWELQELVNLPFQPLLLECKYQVIQSIGLMLQESFGQWKSIPGKDLVLFIDGMDEVPSDKFQDMLAHIRSFSKSHQYITLVFSCRRIFYEHYAVSAVLEDFKTYELYTLDSDDVKTFMQSKLPVTHKKFERIIHHAGLSYFLYHPFFLITLLDIFADKPGKMPTSKARVLEEVIERSFDQQRARRISGGLSIKDKIVLYKSVIQRLALALQLSGLNAINNEALQALFTTEEIELLKVNTLVTKYHDLWSFSNALFQEHLAAFQMMSMPYDQIIRFISVGDKIKKVKTKWIETTSSLLSIMDAGSIMYEKLLRFVEQDNIELIFTTEKAKFDNKQRVVLLRKLFDRYITKQLPPMLIYEEKIAQFIQGDDPAVQFLVETAFNRNLPYIVRQTAIRVLRGLNSLGRYRESFFNQAIKELEGTSEWRTAFNLMEVLTENKMGFRSTAALLMSRQEFCQVHSYRNAIYQYLVTMGWVDDYYDFGLKGITHLVDASWEIHHAGSEYSWEEFLLATQKPCNLKRLLYEMREDTWTRYEEKNSIPLLQLNRKVAAKAIDMFPSDPTIVLAVTALSRKLDRKYVEDAYKVWDEFFTQTETHDWAVRASIDHLFSESSWSVAGLIRASSFDYLLAEWEHREQASLNSLRTWLGKLRYKQLPDAASFYDLLMATTEGTLFADVSSFHDDDEMTEKIKRANDLLYIKDQQSFKKGVQAFFTAFGNNEIKEEDIYAHLDSRLHRRNVDSNFVDHFLLHWVALDDKIARLSKAVEIIEDTESFEHFRASGILHYQFLGTPGEEALIEYVREFFAKHLPKLNYENAYTDTTYRPFHAFIAEMFDKFQFDAPAEQLMELVWLDAGGVRGFDNNKLNNKTSLSEKILAKLSTVEKARFAQMILANLKTGIQAASVLGTHLQLCKVFNLEEAVDIIADLFYGKQKTKISPTDMLEIYLELGGSLSVLLPYFEQMDEYDYEYFQFVQTLIEDYPVEVHRSLKKCMDTPGLVNEWKVKAAQHCCTLGDFTGFEFLVEGMRQNQIAPRSIQSFTKLAKIDTSKALASMQDLTYTLLSPHKKAHFSESPKELMVEWLTLFALKGESDLNQVIGFYDRAFDELKDKYNNAHDLFSYQERVIEKFRDSDKTVYSIEQVKYLLSNLSA